MSGNSHHGRLKLDPWAASSLLQKAIRRGEAELAQHAAATLHQHRGNSIWQRLVNIAVEDVGIADAPLVADVTRLATDKRLRAILGSDAELIRDVCARLVAAPKDRSADYLYCAAMKLASAWHDRQVLTAGGAAIQIAVASDPNEPLIRRAVAALMACTTTGRNGRQSIDGAAARRLIADFARDCPRALLEAVEMIASVRGHPFCLMLPLLGSELTSTHKTCTVVEAKLPKAEFVGGLPLYIFDKHTSIGKRAITALARDNEETRRALNIWVPGGKAIDVTLMAAFYVDAVPVLRKLEWMRMRWLETVGFEADMTVAGCPREGMVPVVEAVRSSLGHLNELRRSLVVRQVRTA